MPDPLTLSCAVALVIIVTLLLRNVVTGLAQPSEDEDEDQLDRIGRELLGPLRDTDLTVPHTKELAVLATCVPAYDQLCQESSLEDLYRLMNHYYRMVTEAADKRRGEIGSLVGEEIVVVFGRILPVEDPLSAALDAALEVTRALAPPLSTMGTATPHYKGVSTAVAHGLAISGPIGSDLRRTYSTLGAVPRLAVRLARRGVAGAVLVSADLFATASKAYEGGPIEGPPEGPAACRISGRRATTQE